MLFRRRGALAPTRVDEIASVLAQPLSNRVTTPQRQAYALEQPGEFLFRVLRSARIVDKEQAA